MGEPGPPPNDVDLLLIGDVDYSSARDVLRPIEGQLNIVIKPTIFSADRWANERDDPFLATTRARPIVELDLSDRVDAWPNEPVDATAMPASAAERRPAR